MPSKIFGFGSKLFSTPINFSLSFDHHLDQVPALPRPNNKASLTRRMTTTILELPREIIDLILTELAIASPQHDILRYALVTKATWSNFLLCRLYESVSLSSPAGIQKFIDCPVKDRYRITSLALAQTEGFYDHHNGSMLPLDVNLVLELLNSLQRQPLRNLELLGKRDPFPRGLWEHPLLAGTVTCFIRVARGALGEG